MSNWSNCTIRFGRSPHIHEEADSNTCPLLDDSPDRALTTLSAVRGSPVTTSPTTSTPNDGAHTATHDNFQSTLASASWLYGWSAEQFYPFCRTNAGLLEMATGCHTLLCIETSPSPCGGILLAVTIIAHESCRRCQLLQSRHRSERTITRSSGFEVSLASGNGV